jgi:hypothetical protein
MKRVIGGRLVLAAASRCSTGPTQNKVKVKLSVCLINYASLREDVWGR